MERRKFLGNAALMATPLILKGIPIFAGDGSLSPLVQSLVNNSALTGCDNKLVIIQLNGGNDGLNMVIPIDRYAQLASARPNVLIPETQTLSLLGNNNTKLHPAMTGLRNLYNEGKVNFVQGVSYPNPNFSHFQAQDIWFTGTTSIPSANTGWLGRKLDVQFPNFPTGYPNVVNPDPIAIQIGGTLPLSLQGPRINMAYNAPNPSNIINVANATPAPAPVSDHGTELTFLRLMKDQSNAYASRIGAAYNAQATLSSMYTSTGPWEDTYLAEQLKIVARLIGGGLKTSIYVVNHAYSFDTHVDQVVASNVTTGYHANALKVLSDAIAAFQEDITMMGKQNKVVGMTFSEFGRRVISNASKGTDHGSGAPVIFFGASVNGGVTGTSPFIPTTSDWNTQVPMQYDYRQLYATVMQDVLCVTPTQSQTILNGTYATLPQLFNATILPLQGIMLAAKWENNKAAINFTAYENETFDKFIIEKSLDAQRFDNIHSIINISALNEQNYFYEEDKTRASNVYYRIKGITKQGATLYSNIIRLDNKAVQELSVFPNPVRDFTINIEFVKPVSENVAITIFGANGEKLFYNQINPNGNKLIKIKVPDYFAVHQLYILNIVYGNTVANEKIVFE
jgi:uncharacterized protein (DUF1501 family)